MINKINETIWYFNRDCTMNAKLTLNGKKIHDDVTISGPTGGQLGDDDPARGPLMLQGDHGPVSFRNIRVREH